LRTAVRQPPILLPPKSASHFSDLFINFKC